MPDAGVIHLAWCSSPGNVGGCVTSPRDAVRRLRPRSDVSISRLIASIRMLGDRASDMNGVFQLSQTKPNYHVLCLPRRVQLYDGSYSFALLASPLPLPRCSIALILFLSAFRGNPAPPISISNLQRLQSRPF